MPLFVNLFANADPRLSEATVAKNKPVLTVGFGGNTETVAWQLTHCQEVMEQNGAIGVTIVEDESQQQLQEAIQEFPADTEILRS